MKINERSLIEGLSYALDVMKLSAMLFMLLAKNKDWDILYFMFANTLSPCYTRATFFKLIPAALYLNH